MTQLSTAEVCESSPFLSWAHFIWNKNEEEGGRLLTGLQSNFIRRLKCACVWCVWRYWRSGSTCMSRCNSECIIVWLCEKGQTLLQQRSRFGNQGELRSACSSDCLRPGGCREMCVGGIHHGHKINIIISIKSKSQLKSVISDTYITIIIMRSWFWFLKYLHVARSLWMDSSCKKALNRQINEQIKVVVVVVLPGC